MGRVEETITVCAECLMASCWQGVFMCDAARDADVDKLTRRQLAALGRENPAYWKTDLELARADHQP